MATEIPVGDTEDGQQINNVVGSYYIRRLLRQISKVPMKGPSTYMKADVEQAFSRQCSIHNHLSSIYIHRVKHPDGSIMLKVGQAKDVDHRLREWQSQCHMDEIELVFEIPFHHGEKFDIQKVGGIEEAILVIRNLKKQLAEEYGQDNASANRKLIMIEVTGLR
ncbi:hypothetical protein B0H10DRAFT_1954956 [Mycena sp. CBHHK59/15]|nr:hypothetical protein B0H10DRAFT_1954956 [Mycena sp. CBHHK59/15]